MLALDRGLGYSGSMRIVRDHQFVRPENRGASVAIGNFDGVHLGHQELINEIINDCKKEGLKSLVVTFSPHPLRIIQSKNDLAEVSISALGGSIYIDVEGPSTTR